MTTQWTISAIDYAVDHEGLTNVAQTLHWRAFKSDENDNTADLGGTVSLEAPTPETFTVFADLDEATVIGWCIAALGEEKVAGIEASLDAQIAEKVTPTRGTGTPWAK